MKLRWSKTVVSTLGPPLIKTLSASWRFRESGFMQWQPPFIFVLWHSRILPLLALHKREGMTLLISRHRDGGYVADLAERWGYRTVRGSSRRGGEVGLLGVVRALQGGAVVAITPDGPRGPAGQVKPGAVAAAQHAGVPIIAAGARASSAWYFQSWDRMCLPKPFAAIDVEYSAPIHIGEGKEGMRQGIDAVQRALNHVTGTTPA